jgi:hypothetical protein
MSCPPGRRRTLRNGLAAAGALLIFVVLATLNSAGYRYGASDQAFYVPAVIRAIHPNYYPEDGAVIEAQSRLTLVDEMVASLAPLADGSVPLLFAALYVVSLALIAAGGWRIGRWLYRSPWTAAALLAALTIRHAVTRTGTNTLEGYFHPRQLAFGVCLLAMAAFLRGGLVVPALLVLAGGLLHPTTALWFAVALAAAAVVEEPRRWRWLAAAVLAGVAAAAWAFTGGPLHGRLGVMDPAWLATLDEKAYLFPLEWPWTVWAVNLSYVPVIAAACWWRRRAGLLVPRERALASGVLALVPVFLLTLPFNAHDVQLAIQLQPARTFWLLDCLATVYVVWMLAEAGARSSRRAIVTAGIVGAAALTRGVYTGLFEFPDRPVVALDIKDDDWGRLMRRLRETPVDSLILADPRHALMHGSSVRVAAERDVFVEASKDEAIGMYDRPIAMRTEARTREIGDFDALTAARARQIAARYGVDYLVTEARLDLPVAFSSGSLRAYALGSPH